MQIITEARKVTAAGMQASRAFTVKAGAHIMTVLSGLYADPIDAMVREYLTNMYDAYLALARVRGMTIEQLVKSPDFTAPVLSLPTTMAPELVFQDFGIGMDMETVWNVYTSYGESTKSGSNDEVGGFGLGSKTAFCYNGGATWTVEARKDGQSHLFMAAIGTDSVPRLDHVQSTPTMAHTGVTIRIPIRRGDLDKVHQAARKYAPHFPIALTVEGTHTPIQPVAYQFRAGGWGLRKMERARRPHYPYGNAGNLTVIMGNVPYTVQVTDAMFPRAVHHGDYEKRYFFSYNHIDLFLPVGSVDIVPSRDNLKYTDRTVDAIRRAIATLLPELAVEVSKSCAACATEWEALTMMLAFNEIPHLASVVPTMQWKQSTVNHTEGVVRSLKALKALDPSATITVYGTENSDKSAIIERTVDKISMRPGNETVVVRDDLTKGTVTATKALLYDRLVNKTMGGRTARYGHKVGHAIIIKSTKITDAQIQDFFGGMPADLIVKASALTGYKVPPSLRGVGKDTLYRFSTASQRWESRVNVPTGAKMYYYVPLTLDTYSNRYGYISLDYMTDMIVLARQLKILGATEAVYGIKSAEIPNFDATVWKSLPDTLEAEVKSWMQNNRETVFYYYSSLNADAIYFDELAYKHWQLGKVHPLFANLHTVCERTHTAKSDKTMELVNRFLRRDPANQAKVHKSMTLKTPPQTMAEAYRSVIDEFPMFQLIGTMWANSYRHNVPGNRQVVLDYIASMR
jgi:hypothetical protein